MNGNLEQLKTHGDVNESLALNERECKALSGFSAAAFVRFAKFKIWLDTVSPTRRVVEHVLASIKPWTILTATQMREG